MTSPLNGIARLAHLGVIRAEGIDAAQFLHNQLTQDFVLLDLSQARLAALCSPKGRMLASFIGFKRSPTDIVLVCSRDILASTLKHLRMFTLRAKVQLSDASSEFVLYGLIGDAMERSAIATLPTLVKADVGPAHHVVLHPADGQPRGLWLAPSPMPPPPGSDLSLALWQWTEVRSVVTTITAPIVQAFVPQMLNFESIGEVNFQKGCYPGQEVVARSQFRSTLKRRAYLAHCEAPLRAGQEIFTPNDTTQPCGIVAQAAAAPQGGFDAIVSLQVVAAEGGALTTEGPAGSPLQLQSLPYALLEDV